MAEHLLSLRDLRVRFQTTHGPVFAVNGVSLDVDPGETLGLVGESGCGKSVTSLAVLRLLPAGRGCSVEGQVIFDGTDLLSLREPAMRAMRGRDLAMVFQDPMTSLNPVLTVGEQIVETIRAHRPVGRRQARDRAMELLGLVGIPRPAQHLRRYPHQFSGGMRQRVMIAMALALEPKLLIADEPTTALDVTIQAQVLELLTALTADSGTAAILITHDLGVIARMTQRTSVMYAGFIVESGTTPALFAQPRHPYLAALLHSVPRLDSDGPDTELVPIEGAPPDLLTEPRGCPFAPRCARRLDVCTERMPPLAAASGPDAPAHGPMPAMAASANGRASTGPRATHLVACHNPVPLPAGA
jgi:oligopeptide/dipeptide ABC transporter ATP-binding protein